MIRRHPQSDAARYATFVAVSAAIAAVFLVAPPSR
jgi:hypothetical protein